ncbi:MAG TPA: lysophospholipid acyltransferase family protein [Candidatus Acidoferrales bacterium]|nr:lysophospholipid acyltransferase family protein [Candidatus Acidoferrales bacterium]
MIRALIFVGFLVVYSPPAALIALPIALITGNGEILWRWGIAGAKAATWLSGVRIHAVGLENLDSKAPYIFMSNHTSNLDPPVMVPLVYRPMSILAKKELFRIPVIGLVFRIGNLVPVDRSNREAAVESVKKAVEVLRSGRSMVVYPEGTRSRDGRMLSFKKGPFHMAIESGVCIAPCTVIGTHDAWPKGKFRIKPMTVTAHFHPPINPRDFQSREDLMRATWETINSALPAPYRT